MMNGPEHYREAEKCLALVNGAHESAVVPTLDECQTMVAIAQVHATLALAADRIVASTDSARAHLELRAAVRGLTEEAVYDLQREEYVIRRPALLDRLRDLVEDPS